MSDELKQEYTQRKERTAALTNLTLQSTEGTAVRPTPTQEENDLLALGLMHPDEKVPPATDKAMPSLAAQQAYMATGEHLPSAAAAPGTRQPAAPQPVQRREPEQRPS
jgi:hypothetical protein